MMCPVLSLAQNRRFYPLHVSGGDSSGITVNPCQIENLERTGHIDGADCGCYDLNEGSRTSANVNPRLSSAGGLLFRGMGV